MIFKARHTNFTAVKLKSILCQKNKTMRTLFISLLIALFLTPQAQNNYELTVPGKEWRVLSMSVFVYSVANVLDNITETIGEPEYIDGVKYFPVYRAADSGSVQYHPGYLREDTLTGKVYFYDHHENEEGLLYDFGIEEGESVTIYNCFTDLGPATMQCTQIDSTLINGEYKRVYHFGNITWIEGIGSLFGLLYSEISGLPGGGHELLCCSLNDVQLFQNDIYNACQVTEFLPKITTEQYDTAYLGSFYEFQLHHTIVPVGDSVRWEAISLPEGLSLDALTGVISGIPAEAGPQPCIVVVENNRIGHRTDYIYEDLFVDEATEISTTEDESRLKIFPNPAREMLTIERNNSKQANLMLYNQNGEHVLSKTLHQRSEQIDCKDIPNGVYFMKLIENEQNQTVKIVIL